MTRPVEDRGLLAIDNAAAVALGDEQRAGAIESAAVGARWPVLRGERDCDGPRFRHHERPAARPESDRGTSYAGTVTADVDRLLAARERSLEDELAELTKPAGEVGAISFGKRVGDGTAMAVDRLAAVSAQEHLLAMLAEVRRARGRLADGTYGRCEVCGERLPEERLEVRPWAVRCVEHS